MYVMTSRKLTYNPDVLLCTHMCTHENTHTLYISLAKQWSLREINAISFLVDSSNARFLSAPQYKQSTQVLSREGLFKCAENYLKPQLDNSIYCYLMISVKKKKNQKRHVQETARCLEQHVVQTMYNSPQREPAMNCGKPHTGETAATNAGTRMD